MMIRIIHIIFWMICAQGIFAQSQGAFIEAAEAAMNDKDYYNAFHHSRAALEFDETDLDLIYLHAEAARHFDAYTVADSLYTQVVESDNNNDFPEATYHLAYMQQRIAKYEDARRNFELFLTEYNGGDEFLLQSSHKNIRAIEWALGMQDEDNQNVTVEKYGADVNSPYSEFGAVVFDEELYYSSLRFPDETSQYNPSRLISKIIVEDDEDGFETEEINDESDEDTEAFADEESELNHEGKHTAHTSFTRNGKRMFYTLCQYENSYDIRCDIYYRDLQPDGNFGEGVKLGEDINMMGYTSTQPSVGYSIDLAQEILFFSSDRPGGKGKMDIWFSMINGEDFSAPRNMEDINTIENEITPFYHHSTDKLYFSSDGYLTLGGYDIYVQKEPLKSESIPTNLGLPINSSFNDVYYTLNEEGDEALFSSNRIGSFYLEDSFEACCYDIYSADIKVSEIELNALTFIESTGDSLNGATVCLLDAETGEQIDEITVMDDNDHIFILELGKEYKVVAKKDGYTPETITVSTHTIPEEGKIQRKLYLGQEMLTLDLTVFDKETLAALEGASITVECVDDPSRTFTRHNVQSNDFKIELDRDCKYKITIHREGYAPQSIIIDATDPFQGNYINRKVYLSKEGGGNNFGDDLSLYLPVKVYYDNDDPEKRNFSFTTRTNYSDSYYPYIARKEEFKQKFAQSLTGDLKFNAEQSVEYFFESEVRTGYERLQVFISKLLESLQAGNTHEVVVRGFTSPRATKKYNLALGQRRVHNVINEIGDYGNGALQQYIDNGQLTFKQISFGEEMSDGKVSDSYPNRRLSVYSPEASRERKAEVVNINKINE